MSDSKYKVLIGPSCEQSGWDERTLEEVKSGVLAGQIVYEAILGEIVPVYDYDEWVAQGQTLDVAHSAALARALTELTKLWGPKAAIYTFSSSGLKTKGDKVGPFVSLRFIVRGVGKFASGADMKRGGYVPEMFDQSVYKAAGKRQLMRLWGASKMGEDRPMLHFFCGKFSTLQEVNTQSADLATSSFEYALAQYVGREQLIEVKQKEKAVVNVSTGCGDVVVGANGMPLGCDIHVTKESVRELCMLAGWFHEADRDYERWRDEIWLLQNTADDYDLGDELDSLMLEISAVCIEKHCDNSVAAIKKVSMNRSSGTQRKNLGQLRAEALKKNEGGYLMWLNKVKKVVAEEKKVEPGVPERVPYLFMDHNTFVGKAIARKTADEWLADAVVMVMNGGDPYFLTRNKKVCEITNRPFELWKNVKADKLLTCLDVGVMIKNPKYDEEKGKIYQMKLAAKQQPTEDEAETGNEFDFVTFGPNKGMQRGFVATQIYQRKMKWVDHEDFIPFLDRRIPDADIAAAVANNAMFNKFRGFPIEEIEYQPQGPKFIGSAWHLHLMNGICHGDMNEWKHLEATIADMIQRPYRISNVAHVFQGAQGTGKSFLHKFMSELLGAAHTMLITDMGIYTQKFNEDQGLAILKVFEEVRGKGDQFINNDRLKADITKLTLRVEIKNGAILTLRHCSRYWMLTNHRDTLHIEADDRRYVYHSVSNEHANDWDYFAPIADELKSRDYIRACFEHFAELEYDCKFVMTAIATDYKNEQKLDSMPLGLKFLKDLIESNMLETADTMRRDGERVSGALLNELYGSWCLVNSHQRGSSSTLMKTLATVGLIQKNLRINGNQVKGVTINKDTLRDEFRTHFKMPNFNWNM